MNEKEILRKKYIELRKEIIDKDLKSSVIIDKIKSLEIYKNSKVVALYNSLEEEVNTYALIKYSLKDKIVLLPKIENDSMNFYRITDKERLIKNKFGILEPIGLKERLYNKLNIDLYIVPGVIFDKEKNRIGFGKGYYDRYLSSSFNTIGICFQEQIIDLLPTDKFDVKMKLVITDKNIYS